MLALEEVEADDQAASFRLAFQYPHQDGTVLSAEGWLHVPNGDGATRRPLLYSAGYELSRAGALAHLASGSVVVTPSAIADPTGNPVVRGPNLDFALIHLARSLPIVDDDQVWVAGGSAGGYMALMVAAETYPLAGVMADCPLVDLEYMARYFLGNAALLSGSAGEQIPVLRIVYGLGPLLVARHGAPGAISWIGLSPLDHLDAITCRASVVHSTADLLVPVGQVTGDATRIGSGFPAGFKIDLAERSLVASLSPRQVEVRTLASPPEAVEATAELLFSEVPPTKLDVPWSDSRRWTVAVLEEGGPQTFTGHFRFHVAPNREPAPRSSSVSTPEQLTRAKLEVLMSRLAGAEWVATGVRSLDFEEREEADVMRSLSAFIRAAPEGALTRLYNELPESLQVLGRSPDWEAVTASPAARS